MKTRTADKLVATGRTISMVGVAIVWLGVLVICLAGLAFFGMILYLVFHH